MWCFYVLTGIHEKDERLACLVYAEESCLDVQAITKCVVERIRQKESTEFDSTGELGKEVTTNPVFLAQAIDCSEFNYLNVFKSSCFDTSYTLVTINQCSR